MNSEKFNPLKRPTPGWLHGLQVMNIEEIDTVKDKLLGKKTTRRGIPDGRIRTILSEMNLHHVSTQKAWDLAGLFICPKCNTIVDELSIDGDSCNDCYLSYTSIEGDEV